ncbi:MAG: hypothetical protein HQL70_03870 [Magnetococcales bacterium]|nr:hypothetical protein [Magnetococcales bacterium]
MGRIKTLIIGASIAFLVSGFLSEGGESGIGLDFDNMLTMGFLVYIWYTLRWATSGKNQKRPENKPTDIEPPTTQTKEADLPKPPTSSSEPYVVKINKNRMKQDNTSPEIEPPVPGMEELKHPSRQVELQHRGLLNSLRVETIKIIHHKAPWAITERGETIGRFRNTPIPAWVRTSDNREADYHGITDDPAMDGSVCIEIPDRSELILSPGLVYLLRS